MRYTTSDLPIINLGRQGENLARTIEIDVSDMLTEWPGATIKLAVKRKYDNEPYWAETRMEDNVLYWPITYADTAYPGGGQLEIRAYSGETLVKSVLGWTVVHDSLTSNHYKTPDPSKWWVDKVLDAADSAQINAEAAAEAVGLAKTAADRANTSAENADTATDKANAAAEDANQAAGKANKAANRLSGVDIDVTMLPPSAEPTATVIQSETQTNFYLGIPKSNLTYATFEVDENMYLLMHSPDSFDDVDFQLNDGVLEVIV